MQERWKIIGLSFSWSEFPKNFARLSRLKDPERSKPTHRGGAETCLRLKCDFPTLQMMHVCEGGPRKDHRGVDLISDVLPFGRLWHGDPKAISNAIGYALIVSLPFEPGKKRRSSPSP